MAEDKDRQSVNFTDRNAVEKFLETDKFRPCANLECSRVALQDVSCICPCVERAGSIGEVLQGSLTCRSHRAL
jgi:hypothetical protein